MAELSVDVHGELLAKIVDFVFRAKTIGHFVRSHIAQGLRCIHDCTLRRPQRDAHLV